MQTTLKPLLIAIFFHGKKIQTKKMHVTDSQFTFK